MLLDELPRWQVLHNLQVEGTLSKYVEMRDLDNLSVKNLMGHPSLISRIKSTIGKIQSNFPETSHKILIVHPPSAFSTIHTMLSAVLNKNTLRKIVVIKAGSDVVQELSGLLDARGIRSWVQGQNCRAGAVHLDAGQVKYIVS